VLKSNSGEPASKEVLNLGEERNGKRAEGVSSKAENTGLH
jgi:hypothetical protein